MRRVKNSHLAGTWYAGTAAALLRQTDELLASADQPRPDLVPPSALVVPHAAYQYSGVTAATAYRSVKGRHYERVVLLAPSHCMRFRGASVLEVDAFETPLGETPVDLEGLGRIARHPLIRAEPRVFGEEHALEVQLPLLQRVLPGVPVVPLIVSSLSAEELAEFAGLLQTVTGPRVLLVASSDFTHYGSRFDYVPFPPMGLEEVRTRLRDLDMGAVERIVAGDLPGFEEYVERTGVTICGRAPLRALLAWRDESSSGHLLQYRTSLDVTGDFDHVVSYAALAFRPRL